MNKIYKLAKGDWSYTFEELEYGDIKVTASVGESSLDRRAGQRRPDRPIWFFRQNALQMTVEDARKYWNTCVELHGYVRVK
jgi:hypothetical protein